MIHEPTAAAMAYGLHTHGDVSIVMVYDMGGGTLDVSLLYLNNGIFEVMAAAGDNRLGGQDFNLALLQYLVREVQRRLPEAVVEGDAEVMRVLREEAERVKVALNDECDCAGNFYDGDAQAVVQVQLPPCLGLGLGLGLT
jgi:molecular chaperone DnaK (HSP70)